MIARGDVLHVLYFGDTFSLMYPNNNAWRDPEYREHEPDRTSGEKRWPAELLHTPQQHMP